MSVQTFLLLISFLFLPPTGGLLQAQSFGTNARMTLGTETNKSAAVRIADLDNDGDSDIVVANGRHWPQQNFAFLNQGQARFNVMRPIGTDRATSYACELADLDGDGDLDIAVGNDMALNQIFLNDGKGQFKLKGTFGEVSSVRSLRLADLDGDGDQDILATCRGRSNAIYFNDGNANFDKVKTFGNAKDATIDVDSADVNGDGHQDLVLANRDGQPNVWLLNDGTMTFSKSKTFGKPNSQSRAVAVGDFNSDGNVDWAIGNIGQANRVFLGDGTGGVAKEVAFGGEKGRTYSLAIADLDLDGDLDLVAGNSGQRNAVFFNNGDATEFRQSEFGEIDGATYGVDAGDLNGDGRPDIAVANSDSQNHVYLNRIPIKRRVGEFKVRQTSALLVSAPKDPVSDLTTDWPSFRGIGGRGVADGFSLPTQWNADADAGPTKNVLWQVDVPGLGHSSPVISGDNLFLLTAVASGGAAPLKVEAGGKPTAADDNGEQNWLLLCFDKSTGDKRWQRTLFKGTPGATRHAKATHANTSVCVSGNRIISFLGSEGLYCHDIEGQLLWKQDLGVINISKYGIGWGFASSPVVHNDRIVLVCDDPDDPYLSVRAINDGKEIWRTKRKGVCERSWGTPLVLEKEGVAQIVVNGWPWIASYDLSDGKEIWRVKSGGDNPTPTPFEANGNIFITNAHGGPSPIYAIRPTASGDISGDLKDDGAKDAASPIVWYSGKGGSYMSTPVVYDQRIFLGGTRGIVRSFDATSGERLFQGRLGSKAGLSASLVAGDKKIFCAAENGIVYVLQAGSELKILEKNSMGAACLATPAISEGTIFIRTVEKLIAVKKLEPESKE